MGTLDEENQEDKQIMWMLKTDSGSMISSSLCQINNF